MAVNRGPHWLRPKEDFIVKLVKRRQEFADIVGAAFAHSLEIDAGGKDLALPDQHHRFSVGAPQLGKAPGQGLAKFDVERVSLAVRKRQHGDSGLCRNVDHGVILVTPRGQNRSACATAMVKTTMDKI